METRDASHQYHGLLSLTDFHPDLHHKRHREADQSDRAGLPRPKYGRLQERISSIFLAAIKVLFLPCPEPILWAFPWGEYWITGNPRWLGFIYLILIHMRTSVVSVMKSQVPFVCLYFIPPQVSPEQDCRRADGVPACCTPTNTHKTFNEVNKRMAARTRVQL
ncbi:hypothetical protein B0I37DRAFT_370761 [Chaetomium sp. MPI-CAGE-AT-0009]|nr:hypothetical protein B0I37DRAFT_370761 [Chaetomium sp. MPI-CAGE-AT-0009]